MPTSTGNFLRPPRRRHRIAAGREDGTNGYRTKSSASRLRRTVQARHRRLQRQLDPLPRDGVVSELSPLLGIRDPAEPGRPVRAFSKLLPQPEQMGVRIEAPFRQIGVRRPLSRFVPGLYPQPSRTKHKWMEEQTRRIDTGSLRGDGIEDRNLHDKIGEAGTLRRIRGFVPVRRCTPPGLQLDSRSRERKLHSERVWQSRHLFERS